MPDRATGPPGGLHPEHLGVHGCKVVLSCEPDFPLGRALVRPSLCEVVAASARVHLQPRVMQVLVCLARADGEVVSRDDLAMTCWSGVVVGEDALNRCTARLRRLSEHECAGDFGIETLPRVGFRLTRAGVVDAEIAPPGVASAASRPRRSAHKRAVWGVKATAGVAVAAVVVGLSSHLRGPAAPPWVAVQPFAALGGDEASRSVAAGMPDALIAGLAAAGLQGAPGASGAVSSAPVVLRGSVEREGGDLRVSAMLTRAADASVLWSGQFSGAPDHQPELRRQVALKIADVLSCAVEAGRDEAKPFDFEVLPFLLRACDAIHHSTADTRDALREVVRRRPRDARANAMLAVSNAFAARNPELPQVEAQQSRADAKSLAETAIRLDPHDGEPYVALDVLQPPSELTRRYGYLRKGLDVEPGSSRLHSFMSGVMHSGGFTGDALLYAARAHAMEPLGPPKASSYALLLAATDDLPQARRLADEGVQQWPAESISYTTRIWIEAMWGDPSRALALLHAMPSLPVGSTMPYWGHGPASRMEAVAQTRKADNLEARRAFSAGVQQDLREGRRTAQSAVEDLMAVGGVDAAFEAAGRAGPSDPFDPAVLFGAGTDRMTGDPRFLPLARRLGLVAFWRDLRRWPDFCRRPEARPVCLSAIGRV